VERVTFHSEHSGFCVLRVRVAGRRELVTLVGTAAVVAAGESVACEGRWTNDPTYGLQFKTNQLRVIPPATLEGVEKYLASGMVRGIGPHFAKQLVGLFGESVFDVIENQPERLTELKGIGPKRRDQVLAAWAEQRKVRDIMVFLQAHGMGTARAVRIYKTYGDEAIERVRANPYRLALDIAGIGFHTADGLAQRLGIPKDSVIRAQAGVRHVLQEFAGAGHCAATREELVATGGELLNIGPRIVEAAVECEIEEGNLIAESISDRPSLFLTPLHRAESGVALQLGRLLPGQPTWGLVETDRAIAWVYAKTRLTLSASQREAITKAANGKLTVVTGGPGVGKTTVVNSILQIVRAKGARVVLCAPTGRAAKRLAEATGFDSRTIHRALEFDPKTMRFKRGLEHPLDADLVVVDELSMVDVVLMNHLLRAIPTTAALLLVGDVDQLPSVGPGAVLGDIIDSGQVPTVRLTEIFRQAAASRIVLAAHRINQGQIPWTSQDADSLSDFYVITADSAEAIHQKLVQVVTERIPRRFGLDRIKDVQVLTPSNRGGLGVGALNVELQGRLNPDAEPRVSRFGWTYAPADKVIQVVNNYDKEVFNGDIGRVMTVDLDEGRLQVDFEGRQVHYQFSELDELCLAYATSVHKSQGSEYPAVVIPLSIQHYPLLERNLLYTGVTRGKQLVVIIGQPKALAMAVKTVRSQSRMTNLRARLRAAL
jgi:exodeoxyribonuclease V alpha subunit